MCTYVYIHGQKFTKMLKVFYLWMMGFYDLSFVLCNSNLLFLYLYLTVISRLSPPWSWASSGRTPSRFLSSLTLSCLCSLTQCLVHFSLHLPLSFFRASLKEAFINETSWVGSPLMSALIPVTVCALPSALLTGGFVLIPLLDCKLPEGRHWILPILSPFGYHLPVFLWGITPFPTGFDFGGMVKVSYQEMLFLWSLNFESWDSWTDSDWRWHILAKELEEATP